MFFFQLCTTIINYQYFFAYSFFRIELMQQTKGFGQAAYNRLKEQKHKITEAVKEEIKQKEQNILNHERNIQTVVFTRIYEKHFEKEVWIISF